MDLAGKSCRVEVQTAVRIACQKFATLMSFRRIPPDIAAIWPLHTRHRARFSFVNHYNWDLPCYPGSRKGAGFELFYSPIGILFSHFMSSVFSVSAFRFRFRSASR
jgi:hypothetical protein